MKVLRIITGDYQANCYIAYCKETLEGIIIDPGAEPEKILDLVEKNRIDIKFIVLTHGHGDHIGGVERIKEELGLGLYIHEDDKELLEDSSKNLSNIMSVGAVQLEADKLIKDGDILEFGHQKAQVIHTPGHTRGGICLKIGEHLFTGDTLFKGSVGRSDLYGGDHVTLINSIKNKLLVLNGHMKVWPGHGDASTINEEKLYNPYLN